MECLGGPDVSKEEFGVLAAARALRTADRARLAQMVMLGREAFWDETDEAKAQRCPEEHSALQRAEQECVTLLYALFKAVDKYEAELRKGDSA